MSTLARIMIAEHLTRRELKSLAGSSGATVGGETQKEWELWQQAYYKLKTGFVLGEDDDILRQVVMECWWDRLMVSSRSNIIGLECRILNLIDPGWTDHFIDMPTWAKGHELGERVMELDAWFTKHRNLWIYLTW